MISLGMKEATAVADDSKLSMSSRSPEERKQLEDIVS
jgi:hypothetical protein